MDSSFILKRLMNRHSRCLCFPELRMGTGCRADADRAIDLFVMEDIPSKLFKRTAYEIKVSASDFSRELSDPTKRRAAVRFANEFYFATPTGLIDKKRIPIECGLIEISEQGYANVVVGAPWHDNAPNWGLVASLARRITDKLVVVDNVDMRNKIAALPQE